MLSSAPLAGITVLDFTRVLAGPYCTMLLGDMGAEVIKVEEPLKGDETRQWGPPWIDADGEALSAYYVCANRNKQSITLDLKTQQGQAIARQLTQKAHIVVENMKPDGMASYGLGYNDLAALNPALVYCSITGFGQTGPYRDRPGYDFVIQAMSGLMSITGPVDGEPYKVGVAITDVIAGLFACTSIVAALRHAEQTGEGQHLDVALLDTALAALVNIASNALVSGKTPQRYGNAHPNIVPYQTFHAQDGPFAVAVGNDRQFAALCRVLQLSELSTDSRFATNPARVANRELLINLLEARFCQQPAALWVDVLLREGIPCGPLNDVSTILDDPQIAARGMIQPVPIDEDRSLPLVNMPVQFSATPPAIRYPPPRHGEHTKQILREYLSLSEEAIETLRLERVI